MNRIEIPEAGVTVEIPASYAEMTRPQIHYVARQLYELQRGAITLSELRVRVLYHLARIKRTVRSIVWERLHPKAATERAERIALLAEQLLGFLFTADDGKLLPAFDALENPLPTIRIFGRRFIGPADGLTDISFEELIAADGELTLYTQTNDAIHIDNLMAILYRRPGPRLPSGRKVKPLEADDCAARVFRFVAPWKKYLFLLWYVASIDNLQHGTFTINGREVSFAPLFSGAEASGKSLGWLGTLYSLAERRIFGDMTATSEASILDILLLLLNDKYNAENVRFYSPGIMQRTSKRSNPRRSTTL